ncbi:N-acetylglucosamine-6-phosphate deacetylase [Azotosporobacter soli]|uniref:N-acetylglucosamine-6-phosphate deacetylase n=1 Tax=Azotosporobacter soli TaxID=3055040 RepID=UPI0031FE5551
MKAIINGRIITASQVLENKVLVFDEQIGEIVAADAFKPGEDFEIIDAAGHYVSPGFIDIHIHGCGGYDTMDEDPTALGKIAALLPQVGVTSFLPTTMTMHLPRIQSALQRIRAAKKAKGNGAVILGAHLEGPYLSPQYKGAQDSAFIKTPDFFDIEDYLDVIRIVTLAPEGADKHDFIQRCRAAQITVSIGHSNANYEQALAAFAAGAEHVTHTFNAMPPLNHRQPGIIGAALDTPAVTCELIVDDVHVHPCLQRMLLKLKGPDHVILISDAMRACLLANGHYDLGGQDVIVSDGEARLASGVIAGSVTTLRSAARLLEKNTQLSLPELIRTVSLTPARRIGVAGSKGSLEIGKDADITIFSSDFTIQATFVAGKSVYRS